jgi:hypothetical protein
MLSEAETKRKSVKIHPINLKFAEQSVSILGFFAAVVGMDGKIIVLEMLLIPSLSNARSTSKLKLFNTS